MESKGCSFEDCIGNMNVSFENHRNVIPWQYYEDFGLCIAQMQEILEDKQASIANMKPMGSS